MEECMDEKKCCTVINNQYYGCCGGTGNDMELLFEGTMNTPDTTYDLLAPITDYKYIVVEAGMHKSQADYWNKAHEIIPNPIISDNYCEYGKLIHVGTDLKRYLIQWHFPTATTLYLDYLDKAVGVWDDTRIGKIYGVK